jgi:hypothetical protein
MFTLLTLVTIARCALDGIVAQDDSGAGSYGGDPPDGGRSGPKTRR